MMFFLDGPPKDLKNPSVPWGFASGAHVDLSMVWGSGPQGVFGETDDPNDASMGSELG